MRPLNIFVAFFGMSLLVIGFLVLINNYGISIPTNQKAVILSDSEGSRTDSSAPPQNDKIKILPAVPFKSNLTQELAAEVGRDFIARNPDGPQNIEDQQWINVATPEKVADSFISEGMKNFNPQDFFPEIKTSSLKIVVKADANADSLYLKTFQDILKHNFGEEKIDLSNPDLSGIKQLIIAYHAAIKDFYNLTVPENFTALHQKEISLLSGEKKIFEDLANYIQDPVLAILAGNLFKKVNQEFSNLNSNVQNFSTNPIDYVSQL